MYSVAHLVFFSGLVIIYVVVVSTPYEYYGFFVSLDSTKLMEGAVLAILVGLRLPTAVNRVSDFLIWLLYSLAIVPSLVIYGCQDRSRGYAFMLAISYIIVDSVRRIRVPIPTLPHNTGHMVTYLSIFVSLVTAGMLVARGGLTYFNLDFLQVYEVRDAIDKDVFGAERGALYQFSSFTYLAVLAFSVCNPFLIFLSLSKRNYVSATLAVILQVFFFAVTSQKTYVYSLLFPAYVYLFGKNARLYAAFISTLIAILGFAGLEYAALGSYEIGGSFVGRTFYLPAILNFTYQELFSKIGYVYLGNSRFNPFAEYSSLTSLDPAYLVGWVFSGNPNMNANNGFLATSFMHFGYTGMVVYSIIVGLLLALVDVSARTGEVIWIRLSIVLLPFLDLLTSVDLTTSFLSHGLLACLVLSWLYSGVAESGFAQQALDHGTYFQNLTGSEDRW